MDNGSFETKDELDSEVGGSRDEAVRSRKPSEKPCTPETKSQKRRIYKNVLLVSISFLLLFVAFESMSKLQSSINTVDNLGLWSSVVIYASLILSCLFVPSLVISKLTLKWTMVASILCYSTYIAAQFYPQVRAFRTLIQFTLLTLSQTISHQQLNLTKPTRTSSTLCCQREQWSVLLLLRFGRPSALSSLNLLAGRLLLLLLRSLTLLKFRLVALGEEGEVEAVMAKFFGVFFFFFQCNSILGNLISTAVLSTGLEVGLHRTISQCNHVWALRSPNSTFSLRGKPHSRRKQWKCVDPTSARPMPTKASTSSTSTSRS